mgnify:CR=1 FL=1
MESVETALKTLSSESDLTTFIELEVKEKAYSASTLSAVDALVSNYQDNIDIKILKSKTIFDEGTKDTADLFQEGENIEDLQPQEVFSKLLDQEEIDEDKTAMLMEAFVELLEEVQTEEI